MGKVALALIEKNGKFLLINRQRPHLKLSWAFPGGVVEEGETEEQAVVREAKEEVNLDVQIVKKLLERKHPNTFVELVYFHCILVSQEEPKVLEQYEQGKPVGVEFIVLATPHDPEVSKTQVKEELYKSAVLPTLEIYNQKKIPLSKVILNGTGRWEIGGPAADTGVTGRKIAVDTYGGMGRVGGGCFSGKDVTKVDRSAAYGARFIAKNVVAAGLASRCEVQLAYVIGYKDPVAYAIETFGTGKSSQKKIEDYAWKLLDLSTQGIIEGLDLRRPIYKKTAIYGHFGNPDYPWEKIVAN